MVHLGSQTFTRGVCECMRTCRTVHVSQYTVCWTLGAHMHLTSQSMGYLLVGCWCCSGGFASIDYKSVTQRLPGPLV